MKQLVAMARNIRHWITPDSTIEPEIEVILTVMGRCQRFDGGGIVQSEYLRTLRFRADPAAARKLADNLREWADEADVQRRRLAVHPEE